MRKVILAVSFVLLAYPICYSAPQQESVAEAARKARQQKKKQAKPAKVITNDDIASVSGGVSVIGTAAAPAGEAPPSPEPEGTDKKAAGKPGQPEEEKGEAYWRKRFAEARGKLRDAQKELDIMQRELNLKEMQYYPDPSKALQEQYNRKEIEAYRQKIEAKRKEVEQLRKALSDLEDELRRAGGSPGWAREP